MRKELTSLNETNPDPHFHRDNSLLTKELDTLESTLTELSEPVNDSASSKDSASSDINDSASSTRSSKDSASADINERPMLKNYIWQNMIPEESKKTLLSMMHGIPPTRFHHSRGGDEGFDDETSCDLALRTKKVYLLMFVCSFVFFCHVLTKKKILKLRIFFSTP